ncbi:MAG TPA: 30S ribosomal protein S6, partial [Pyrinomonadaceae bacterium]|nr:30S ribosomal protein S6 [Pyrinomonadaceae bacterium]
MAEQRIYEVVFIVDPDAGEEETARLTDGLRQIVADQGGNVTKNEPMGRRNLAYRIGRKTEGVYHFFEIEGTGREIAELERRMRGNDQVLRYLTVRVDEERRRAEKFKTRRARKAAKRGVGGGSEQQQHAPQSRGASRGPAAAPAAAAP